MAKPDPEALAKALRENLLKRKAQGRGVAPTASGGGGGEAQETRVRDSRLRGNDDAVARLLTEDNIPRCLVYFLDIVTLFEY